MSHAATRTFLHGCFSIQPTQEEYETMLAFNMMVPPKVRLGMSNRPLNVDDMLRSLTLPVLASDAWGGGQEHEPDCRRVHGKDDPLCKSVGLRGHRLRLFLDDLVERFPKGIVGRSPCVEVLASRHRSAWAPTTTIRKAFVLAAPQISRP